MKHRSILLFSLGILIGLVDSSAQPILTKHPTNQSVSLGANVVFTAAATGTPLLKYVWRFNDTNIVGTNAPTLLLTNVSLASAGRYSATAIDETGSVTSNPALLEVDPTFTKITSGAIVTNASQSLSAAWGDFDGDGSIDLVVGNRGADFLYRNQGGETFAIITNSPVAVDDADGGAAVAWADYDNDGHLDLIVGGFGGPKNKLFHNNGNATLTKVTGNSLTAEGDGNGVAWGDFNNDGYLDVLITSESGPPNRLYRNTGNGSFTKLTSASAGTIASDAGHSIACVWSDYDNDGDLDLFVTRFGEKNSLYRNNGDGSFSKLFKADIGDLDAAPALSCGAAWGDYDNDGDLDLFVTQGGDQTATDDALYRNNGNGSFTKMTPEIVGSLVHDLQPGLSCAWADYDNDGWLDLYVTNPGRTRTGGEAGRKNLMYHNKGDGTFTQVITGSPANDVGASTSAIWGDYDNDGFMDLFVVKGHPTSRQTSSLYHNNGGTNRWIKFNLEGNGSNRSAIGAKVRVKATIHGKTFWQMREISGGDGFFSQNDSRPNFGLGDAIGVEMVRIEWPSGIVQELGEKEYNSIIVIKEPARLLGVSIIANSENEVELKVQAWDGFVQVSASVDLQGWTPVVGLPRGIAPVLKNTVRFPDPEGVGASQRFYRLLDISR